MEEYTINDLNESFKKFNNALAKATKDASYFFTTLNRVYTDCCREAVRSHYSNNWLKMHGLPMRRKSLK